MNGRAFTTRQRATFLRVLQETCNVTAAAKAVGAHRTSFHNLRARDPKFAAEWEAALEAATDTLEAEARRRALEGTAEPVVSAGRHVLGPDGQPLYMRRYSDTLMTVLLKGYRRERFSERNVTQITGPDDGPIQLEAVSRERLAARIATLALADDSNAIDGVATEVQDAVPVVEDDEAAE